MDIQTGQNDTVEAANFNVAVLQRQVFSHSNITAFFVNIFWHEAWIVPSLDFILRR